MYVNISKVEQEEETIGRFLSWSFSSFWGRG